MRRRKMQIGVRSGGRSSLLAYQVAVFSRVILVLANNAILEEQTVLVEYLS
jgi:hypothetical protein